MLPRPCFVFSNIVRDVLWTSVTFYFSCCAECGMSSVDSDFECLCLGWGTILKSVVPTDSKRRLSLFSTLVPAFPASWCGIAWGTAGACPCVPEHGTLPTRLHGRTVELSKRKTSPPTSHFFQIFLSWDEKTMHWPWSGPFWQDPQHPSPNLGPEPLCYKLYFYCWPQLQTYLAPSLPDFVRTLYHPSSFFF